MNQARRWGPLLAVLAAVTAALTALAACGDDAGSSPSPAAQANRATQPSSSTASRAGTTSATAPPPTATPPPPPPPPPTPTPANAALLARASQLVSQATADNLDAGPVPALAAQLSAAQTAGGDVAGAATQLTIALNGLQQLIAANDAVSQQLAALMPAVDQAAAEQTSGAGAEMASYQAAKPAFQAARTMAQMSVLQAQVASLTSGVQADLTSQACGHPVPPGKVITISLSLQEMVFYQDGCAVRATPITTGRPALPTPAGSFQVFEKDSPYVMRSPWPPGSPFWYPTTTVRYAMEFAAGGYFIHDASWEAASEYGPGGQNTSGASHGCVHVPNGVMPWLYSWAQIGTPVIISP